MGSCQIHRSMKSHTKSSLGILPNESRNLNLVTRAESSFLSQIFQELCIRNHSSKSLEKNIFLIFFAFKGLLGERLFEFYDKDKDGYIDQDQFVFLVQRFTKSSTESIAQDLFLIADLKNDNMVYIEEFTQIFQPVIQEILENPKRNLKTNQNSSFFHSTSSRSEFLVSTYCSMSSITDHIWKGNSDDFIQKLFQRYEQGMNLADFTLFLQSHEIILKQLVDAFRYSSWSEGLHMKIKKCSNLKSSCQNQTSLTASTLKLKDKTCQVLLLVQEEFLIIISPKREILNIILIEACQIKRVGKKLKLFYFSHFEERLKLKFESEETCEAVFEGLNVAGNLKDFKDFYNLGEKIGSGKFSFVYEATELATGVMWAVKVVKKKQLTRFEREMIRKETEIMKSVSGNGVIRIREIFESRKSLKIVMELVRGGDLTKHFNEVAMDEERVKNALRQVLATVEHLHSHGIMHRDIKPENILVSGCGSDMKTIFIDFGLSTFFLPGERKKFKCGTFGYMAPEVARGNYTEKSDIWSVGVLTYACLTGKLPFSGYSDEEIIHLTQTAEPDYSESRWHNSSCTSQSFTKWLLTKDPQRRPTCKEALNHEWFMH